MFVDPEEAQVRVSMIIRVDQNDVGFLCLIRCHDGASSREKYRFHFHAFIFAGFLFP